MVLKNCFICDKEFDGWQNIICCSKNCKLLNRKLKKKIYRTNNKEKINNQIKLWQENNKEKIKRYSQKYIKSEKCKNYKKEYYIKNKDKFREREKIYSQTEKNKLYRKEYYIKAKDKRKIYLNNYFKNTENKIKRNIRTLINNCLKENKNYSSIKYLGCDVKFYKKYIENQFSEKMNWNNYGTYWEIDHLIPLNTFNLLKNREQLIAFNYLNTRPLLKLENIKRPKNGSDIGRQFKNKLLSNIKLNIEKCVA